MKQTKKPGKNQLPGGLPLWIGLVTVAAFAAFSPCLSGELLSWDDNNYIRDNLLIREFSLANILHVFHYKTFVVGNYHPVTILSYILEYQVAGTNPFLYHFDNLLLHLFNVVLIARLVWLLTKRHWATLVASALFALHPMRVESVVWAAERKDVLYTFFFLLSLICYVRFLVTERRKALYSGLSLLFFILSVLSKGQAVVLPLVLFLIDYWYGRKINLKSALNKVPYLAVSLLSGVLALVAQQSSLTEQRLMAHTPFERLSIAGFNISAYLYKFVNPFNLSFFYQYPGKEGMVWVHAGALAAVVIIAATLYYFRKNRVVIFGSLFFLFTLSIVTQILPVGNAIIADRYTYVPYIGLFFIAGMLLDPLLAGTGNRSKTAMFLTAVVMVLFSVKTYAQSRIWHDNVSLYKGALAQDPGNSVALVNLGNYYNELERYDTAIILLEQAIRYGESDPEIFNGYQNLGLAYARSGRQDEAIRNFTAAFERKPGYSAALMGRGLAYTDKQRYDSALADFTLILKTLDPQDTRALYSRGIAWNRMGLPDSAIADYSAAIAIDPAYSNPYVNRGNIYFSRNQYAEAIADYNTALRLSPGDGSCHMNRSFALFRLGRYQEALDDALKAQDLKVAVHPNYISDLQNAIR